MHYYLLMLIMSWLVVGCTAISPAPKVPEKASSASQSAVSRTVKRTPEDRVRTLPPNLQPDELEQRDDTTVVIRAGKRSTIKEYHVGGVLYGIQVIPKVGRPYFLVPANEPGFYRRPDQPERLIPSWQILQWQ